MRRLLGQAAAEEILPPPPMTFCVSGTMRTSEREAAGGLLVTFRITLEMDADLSLSSVGGGVGDGGGGEDGPVIVCLQTGSINCLFVCFLIFEYFLTRISNSGHR